MSSIKRLSWALRVLLDLFKSDQTLLWLSVDYWLSGPNLVQKPRVRLSIESKERSIGCSPVTEFMLTEMCCVVQGGSAHIRAPVSHTPELYSSSFFIYHHLSPLIASSSSNTLASGARQLWMNQRPYRPNSCPSYSPLIDSLPHLKAMDNNNCLLLQLHNISIPFVLSLLAPFLSYWCFSCFLWYHSYHLVFTIAGAGTLRDHYYVFKPPSLVKEDHQIMSLQFKIYSLLFPSLMRASCLDWFLLPALALAFTWKPLFMMRLSVCLSVTHTHTLSLCWQLLAQVSMFTDVTGAYVIIFTVLHVGNVLGHVEHLFGGCRVQQPSSFNLIMVPWLWLCSIYELCWHAIDTLPTRVPLSSG